VRSRSVLGARRGTTGSYDLGVGRRNRADVRGRKVGTRRTVRPLVRGRDAARTCRPLAVYVPSRLRGVAPDLFIHPAGYCQNVLGTGACAVTGTTVVAGREAIVVECDHPRTIEVTADRPDFRIRMAVDRADGVILRLEESMGGQVTRDAVVTSYEPDAVLPPATLAFEFPSDTTFIY
jgi:hypothetical protein